MFAVQVAVMKGRGGVFTSLFHYARMWSEVGVKSVCVYRGPVGDRLREGGVDVIEAPPTLTSPFFALTPDFARLRAQIIERGGYPDCAMVHSDLALANMRRMFSRAVMMTRCHSDKTKRKREADVVVTLNPDQHERVTRELAGAPAKTFMLGHPFVMDPPPAPVSGEGPLRFNYVARFVAEKDPMTFARAVGLMKARAAVRFIGDGPMESEVRSMLAESKVSAEFLGWRTHPFGDFTRNDVLVLPSTWEGLPWLLLEAQARAVATIASDISGNKLALASGAYGDLFPAGDACALAERLDAAAAGIGALRAKAERGRADLPGRYGPRAFWNGLLDAMAQTRDARTRNV